MHPATSVQRGSAFNVRVSRDASYEALYEPGLLRCYGEVLRDRCGLASAVVLTDAVRYESVLHELIEPGLDRRGIPIKEIEVGVITRPLLPHGPREEPWW